MRSILQDSLQTRSRASRPTPCCPVAPALPTCLCIEADACSLIPMSLCWRETYLSSRKSSLATPSLLTRLHSLPMPLRSPTSSPSTKLSFPPFGDSIQKYCRRFSCSQYLMAGWKSSAVPSYIRARRCATSGARSRSGHHLCGTRYISTSIAGRLWNSQEAFL